MKTLYKDLQSACTNIVCRGMCNECWLPSSTEPMYEKPEDRPKPVIPPKPPEPPNIRFLNEDAWIPPKPSIDTTIYSEYPQPSKIWKFLKGIVMNTKNLNGTDTNGIRECCTGCPYAERTDKALCVGCKNEVAEPKPILPEATTNTPMPKCKPPRKYSDRELMLIYQNSLRAIYTLAVDNSTIKHIARGALKYEE